MKIVVLDFDETLGYFTQFSVLWESLKFFNEHVLGKKIIFNQDFFNKLLDLYPLYLRPNIFEILRYLMEKKKDKSCKKIMIYSNNTGISKWINYFINYFESKLNYKLFDNLIAAFKIKGKIIEICRTKNEKTYDDLIKCTQLPLETEICFIDDVFYPNMINDKVYYINIKPYYYDYKFEYMIDLIIKTNDCKDMCDSNFKTNMMQIIKRFNYKTMIKSNDDLKIDSIVSKETINHLKQFFMENKQKTLKIKYKNTNRNKTRKNI